MGAQEQAGKQNRTKLEARIENHIAKDVEAEGKWGFFKVDTQQGTLRG